MNCTNCGSYVAPGKRFCSDCGSPAEDPELTRIARVQSHVPVRTDEDHDLEDVIFTVRPTMIFIKVGYLIAALLAIGLVVLLAQVEAPVLLSVPIAFALLLIPAYYHLRRNTVRYTLTDSKIEIDKGLIARTTRNIPLTKIQDVTVQASIPQRLLGFGDVIVDNASDTGGMTKLENISNPRHYAELVLRELRRRQ